MFCDGLHVVGSSWMQSGKSSRVNNVVFVPNNRIGCRFTWILCHSGLFRVLHRWSKNNRSVPSGCIWLQLNAIGEV